MVTIQEKIAIKEREISTAQAEIDKIRAFLNSTFPNVVNKNLLLSNRFLGQFPDRQSKFFQLNTQIQRAKFALEGFARSIKRAIELEQQRQARNEPSKFVESMKDEPDKTVFKVDFEQLRIKREQEAIKHI